MQHTTKKFLGRTGLIVLILIPVYLWFAFGDPGGFATYGDSVHSFGELFGLIGMTIFALTFVLSTRIKWIEDVFGGLDKVYLVHGILGGSALIFILAHPIFLVLKFIPSNMAQAAAYLLPSQYWSTNFGIIALFGMLLLIWITLYTKMKYHRWKFTHEFLGLVFFFAVLHVFLIRGNGSEGIIFQGYYIYAAVVSIIGLWAFSYSLFLKNRAIKNAVYKIKNIKHVGEVFEIVLTPEHKPISYKSGQFIFVRFYNQKLSTESHPFSIASKSDSEELKIIVKKLGDFTRKMVHLNPGDKVSVEGPYGRFNFKNHKNRNQIWLGSGIGVVPFIGMSEEVDEHKSKVDFYYTEKERKDFVGLQVLEEVSKKSKNFRFIPWASKERGRINVHNLKELSGDLSSKEFLICGSPSFKESLINQLLEVGVKKSRIHEEVFDFR